VPLSEHEQQLLEQIERALYDEDPKFATKVQSTTPRTQAARKALRSLLIIVAGLALVVLGVSTKLIPLGIVGFAIMLAGGVLLVLGARTAPAGTEASPKPKKSKGTDAGTGSLGGKMEDRWRRRWEDRD
jgi:Flp pilus assembly protein TadB